jgi:hypothetical protein
MIDVCIYINRFLIFMLQTFQTYHYAIRRSCKERGIIGFNHVELWEDR